MLKVCSFAQNRMRASVPFEPHLIKQEQAKADGVIEYAKAVMDWPLLEEAVEAKIAQQEEFVAWWRENVRRAGHQPKILDREIFTVEQAETLTEIDDSQVSRWRKRLADKAKFLERQIASARRKAGECSRTASKTQRNGSFRGHSATGLPCVLSRFEFHHMLNGAKSMTCGACSSRDEWRYG